jgi:carbonic anhydrase
VAPPAGDPTWGYEAPEGPSDWGKLSPKWAACAAGKNQSPVDIDKTTVSDLAPIRSKFRPIELKIIHHEHTADIVNTGHSIQVNYGEGDTLTVGDKQFELLQFHFHSPSEHTVAGKHYPMEMHMVHRSADGKLAVVGVFIAEGAANPIFEPALANLPQVRGVEHHYEHAKVDVNQLLPSNTASYRYSGSLTTPPCSEDVQWIVMKTPIELSGTQLDAFRNVIKGNNRPPQPLNGRRVATDRMAERAASQWPNSPR